jgi:hypothetical protein
MRGLVRGDRITVAQGYWVVVRIFRIGQYSQYWEPARGEAIGGPKWQYDDYTLRSISVPALSEEAGMVIGNADDIKDTEIFALEYNKSLSRLPETGDVIYKIREYESVMAPEPPLHVTDRFVIVNDFTDHGDYGRAEVLLYLAKRAHGQS